MKKIFDYIIIGAGPAGCFCAAELSKEGLSVCILEKNAENTRKVCGDGINAICTEVLKKMDFPIERLIVEGSVPIRKYHIYQNGVLKSIDLMQEHKTVYGLPRNKTDLVFQHYVKEVYHVPIYYNTYVKDIKFSEGIYLVGHCYARKIVLATGTHSPITLDGIPLFTATKDRPIGVSMILRGKQAEESYFLFDYDNAYKGTYAWIFCIGQGIYNVGIWLKEDKAMIRNQMTRFLQERVNEWIGYDYEVLIPLKGALMGIGERVISHYSDIYIIGDAANSSNPVDGEGISRAVIEAKKLALQIVQGK